MRRPSATLIVALVGVVGLWAGPAVATHLLTSKDIRDRSIQGRDLKSNTVTGRVVQGLSGRDVKDDTLDGMDIDESALGKVRSAESADRAAVATVAEALAGGSPSNITRLYFARSNGSDDTVYEAGGLRIRAVCSAIGALSVTASTPGGPAFIRVSGTRTAANNTATPFSSRDDDLRAGDEFEVVPGEDDNAVGQLVYAAADGSTITVDFIAEQGIVPTRGFTCLLAGTAVHAAP